MKVYRKGGVAARARHRPEVLDSGRPLPDSDVVCGTESLQTEGHSRTSVEMDFDITRSPADRSVSFSSRLRLGARLRAASHN